ncbi:GNAT family N-acetyltransferase [Paenibacillus sp. FSL K6-3182]|uniref:GNAT family N-acetyltransferase n=1 Tax=Paenibacillus sp. FSL K6-3182 TaxID=2921495 RepID=UPI0030CD1170
MGSGVRFLVARMDEDVVGTISIEPCNDDIIHCTGDRMKNIFGLDSLYVLREHQCRGIGSASIKGMANCPAKREIESFCPDSGCYRHVPVQSMY